MNMIAHGIDLAPIGRIERMLDEHPDRFRERCFTPTEQAYADAAGDRSGERYAARFACKEAVMKALGTGWRTGVKWTDIGVVHEPSGRPAIRLTGHCADLAAEMGIDRWLVSLTHAAEPGARGYAMASVIGVGDSE